MFYTAEDVQPVVNAAIEVFGKQAQYRPSPFVYISIEIPKYGCVWYGDVSGDYSTVKELSNKLSTKLNEPVRVRDLGTSEFIV